MRIEMVGPPTSGKSSLVRALKEKGIRRGIILPPEDTPKQWQPFVNFINKTYEGTTYNSLSSKTLSSLATAWAGDRFIEPKVYDELVILCGISMAIRFPEEYANKYFAEAPLPSILVYLTANKNTLVHRNKLRGEKSRVDKTLRAVDACHRYIPVLEERGCNILKFNTSNTSLPVIVYKVLEEIYAKYK